MHRIQFEMRKFFDMMIEMHGREVLSRTRLLSVRASIGLICFMSGAFLADIAHAQSPISSGSDSDSVQVEASAEPALAGMDYDFDPDLDRWVFSTAFEVGVLGYEPKASMSGSDLDPNAPIASNVIPANDGPLTVIDPNSDRGRMISALLGVNFEVMAPRLSNRAWLPRPFLDVNVSAVLGSERSIVRNRNPEPSEIGLPPRTGNSTRLGATLIRGTGEQVTAQQQGPAVFIGMGGAFTFDLESGSRLRVKPSIVYSRTPVDVSGIVSRAVRTLNNTTTGLDAFRFIVVSDAREEVYHGIGPALEFELDTNNRVGPFELSLFLKGHANHNFGDLDTDLQQSNSEFPLETVRWRYEHERWTYRASTGIRLRLVGKK